MKSASPYAPLPGQTPRTLALEVLNAQRRALVDLAEAAGFSESERLAYLRAGAAGLRAGVAASGESRDG